MEKGVRACKEVAARSSLPRRRSLAPECSKARRSSLLCARTDVYAQVSPPAANRRGSRQAGGGANDPNDPELEMIFMADAMLQQQEEQQQQRPRTTTTAAPSPQQSAEQQQAHRLTNRRTCDSSII